MLGYQRLLGNSGVVIKSFLDHDVKISFTWQVFGGAHETKSVDLRGSADRNVTVVADLERARFGAVEHHMASWDPSFVVTYEFVVREQCFRDSTRSDEVILSSLRRIIDDDGELL